MNKYGTGVWPVPLGPVQGLPRPQSFFPSKKPGLLEFI
jgi:hypothetical protein